MISIDEQRDLLGPFPAPVPLNVRVVERVDCGHCVREKVRYDVEHNDTVSAYVFRPASERRYPAVVCHHQHQGDDYFGKDEPAGLAGDPELAYARELAQRGFLTIAPDALCYGERRHESDPVGCNYWEMAKRLVQGSTLLAKNIHDVSRAIDCLCTRSDVDVERIGFLGHSYGGRVGVWTAAFDKRIKAPVCNCGCISYKESLAAEAGIQFPFVVQGIMRKCDIEDVVKLIEPNSLLMSVADDDKWTRGAAHIYRTALPAFRQGELRLVQYHEKHAFTRDMRENAYSFLERHLRARPGETSASTEA